MLFGSTVSPLQQSDKSGGIANEPVLRRELQSGVDRGISFPVLTRVVQTHGQPRQRERVIGILGQHFAQRVDGAARIAGIHQPLRDAHQLVGIYHDDSRAAAPNLRMSISRLKSPLAGARVQKSFCSCTPASSFFSILWNTPAAAQL